MSKEAKVRGAFGIQFVNMIVEIITQISVHFIDRNLCTMMVS